MVASRLLQLWRRRPLPPLPRTLPPPRFFFSQSALFISSQNRKKKLTKEHDLVLTSSSNATRPGTVVPREAHARQHARPAHPPRVRFRPIVVALRKGGNVPPARPIAPSRLLAYAESDETHTLLTPNLRFHIDEEILRTFYLFTSFTVLRAKIPGETTWGEQGHRPERKCLS